ncbi:MAG: hypothetical protein Harvfovirus8_17 [Harvfovirus sp.]|uniref:Uncharacterized protein n=1 Tax=Harvfovirus sp. TaxID=2487768 RepID=A0A3G5A0V1_9VIRU|nr:MAG: hypothetical protein Harvfovirus8_17 [Harvfovirus sp.]
MRSLDADCPDFHIIPIPSSFPRGHYYLSKNNLGMKNYGYSRNLKM